MKTWKELKEGNEQTDEEIVLIHLVEKEHGDDPVAKYFSKETIENTYDNICNEASLAYTEPEPELEDEDNTDPELEDADESDSETDKEITDESEPELEDVEETEIETEDETSISETDKETTDDDTEPDLNE